MDRKLLDILVCPDSKQPLHLLSKPELAAINQAIDAGTVKRGDDSIEKNTWSDGLISRDRKIAYRINDGIPVLLIDESIATIQIAEFPRE